MELEGEFSFSKGWYERFIERRRKIQEGQAEEGEWEFSITRQETD